MFLAWTYALIILVMCHFEGWPFTSTCLIQIWVKRFMESWPTPFKHMPLLTLWVKCLSFFLVIMLFVDIDWNIAVVVLVYIIQSSIHMCSDMSQYSHSHLPVHPPFLPYSPQTQWNWFLLSFEVNCIFGSFLAVHLTSDDFYLAFITLKIVVEISPNYNI